MHTTSYLMENEDEALRLEVKTDRETLCRQASWAGIAPGMRVADIGCGAGITTAMLRELVGPNGSAVGIDASSGRIAHARQHHGLDGITFHCRDMQQPLEDLGMFDFVWVRFVLEYFRADSFSLVENIARIVKPGGILCLIDLDYNCLTHFGIPERLERTLQEIIDALQTKADFDPFVGRKLYSFLFDMEFSEIDVTVGAHHLIFGELRQSDSYNWLKKVETAPRKIGYSFPEYGGNYDEFVKEFELFFKNPRRFTYSPIIACRGIKPAR